jgi:hypothetical protein
VREKFLKKLRNHPQPLSLSDISKAALEFVQHLKYTKEQREKVEVETRVQSLSRRWFEERQFRITASKFGVVIKRETTHFTGQSTAVHITQSSSYGTAMG